MNLLEKVNGKFVREKKKNYKKFKKDENSFVSKPLL